MAMSKLERLKRRKEIGERYIRLETQWEIGHALGLSQGQVSRELHALRAEWQAEASAAIAEIIARELARIDDLERTYRAAWEKSCSEHIVHTGKKVTGERKGKPVTLRDEVSRRAEARDGNPEFLRGIERCIRLRGEIVGYIGASEGEEGGIDAGPISAPVVEDAAWFGQSRTRVAAVADAASNPSAN